jgi:hypothetical protein
VTLLAAAEQEDFFSEANFWRGRSERSLHAIARRVVSESRVH